MGGELQPSDLNMLELPPNIEQFATAVEEEDEEVPAASAKARTLPQLRPSLFPNVPPFINFLALGEECGITSQVSSLASVQESSTAPPGCPWPSPGTCGPPAPTPCCWPP